MFNDAQGKMEETGISPDDDDDDDDMLFVRWYRDLNIDFDTTGRRSVSPPVASVLS